MIRGRQRIELFGRMLPEATVVRATAVTTLGVLTCVVMLAALQLTQALPLDVALFEIVSALATVGLSTGATSALDEAGKIIIIVCMFAGRVGPLTFFIFLTAQTVKTWPHRFPEEAIPIG